MEIHVVLFKGIPEVAFYKEKDLATYLKKEGTSLEKVREDMESNTMVDWEAHEIEAHRGMFLTGWD
jgi:hypothetical protein